MNINDLPDLCLHRILSQLSVHDKSHLHLVHPRWAAFQPELLRQSRHLILGLINRESTELLSTDMIPYVDELVRVNQHFPSHEPADVEYANLTSETLTELQSTFPKVSCLEVRVNALKANQFTHLIAYINSLAGRLRTLRLFVRILSDHPRATSLNLYLLTQSLNQPGKFPYLRHLTFGGHDHFLNNPRVQLVDQLDFPLLCQLEEFYFASTDRHCILWDALIAHTGPQAALRAPGTLELSPHPHHHYGHLRRIGLVTHITRSEHLNRFLGMNDSLAKCFTYLTVNVTDITEAQLVAFTGKFSNLTNLSLAIGQLDFPTLTRELARLTHLKQLSLHIDLVHHLRPPIQCGEFHEVLDALTPLLTIQLLTLQPSFGKHSDMHSTIWSRMFPNVTSLKMFRSSWQCADCGFENILSATDETLHSCASGLMADWLQCPKITQFESVCTAEHTRRWNREQMETSLAEELAVNLQPNSDVSLN